MPNEQSADAFRRIAFMTGNRHHIYRCVIDSNGNLTDRLCGVRMEQNTMFATDARDLVDGLKRSDFVVGVHNAYQSRVVSDCLGDVDRVDNTVNVTGDNRHGVPEVGQMSGGFTNSGVFEL